MRKKIVAGNWKMNKTYTDALALVTEIKGMVADEVRNSAEIIIAPPFIYLHSISHLIKDIPNIKLSAQNCASEASGAYTGEVSVEMLKSINTKYVIIGHSERRAYYGENTDLLIKKLNLIITNGLTPIYCCGETLSERESGNHFKVVQQQIQEALFHLDVSQAAGVVIAYEPVWAIGTGLTATAAQAQEMHAYIRKVLADKYSNDVAQNITILYGGSCNPGNAAELFSMPDVDGGLIGGASLKSRDFVEIVKAMNS